MISTPFEMYSRNSSLVREYNEHFNMVSLGKWFSFPSRWLLTLSTQLCVSQDQLSLNSANGTKPNLETIISTSQYESY